VKNENQHKFLEMLNTFPRRIPELLVAMETKKCEEKYNTDI